MGNLVLYNGSLLNRVQNEFAQMEKLFNDLFSSGDSFVGFNSGYPKCNVIELDDKFIVEMAVAGLKKEDIKIKVEENQVKVEGGKQVKYENAKYHVRELSSRAFAKTISIPRTVNGDKIDAKFEDGVLEIYMPKENDGKDLIRVVDIK